MEYVVYAIIMVASAAASYYASRRAQSKQRQAVAGSVDVATAEAGRPIMVLAGTRIIKSPNTGWFGDVRSEAIQK